MYCQRLARKLYGTGSSTHVQASSMGVDSVNVFMTVFMPNVTSTLSSVRTVLLEYPPDSGCLLAYICDVAPEMIRTNLVRDVCPRYRNPLWVQHSCPDASSAECWRFSPALKLTKLPSPPVFQDFYSRKTMLRRYHTKLPRGIDC